MPEASAMAGNGCVKWAQMIPVDEPNLMLQTKVKKRQGLGQSDMKENSFLTPYLVISLILGA